MAILALIPAAGSGTRVGGALPKQYQCAAGKPLLAHVVAAFAEVSQVDATYVVLAPDDTHFAGLQLPAEGIWVGAQSRHESVLSGLDALAGEVDDDDWIMVHDAARPGLTPALISRLINRVGDDEVGGLLALPIADTLKRAYQNRSISTVPRQDLWQAQTPQMFRFGLLRRALAQAIEGGLTVTDEASAIEALGLHPQLVPGSPRNFKVTWADDLILADALLSRST